MALLSNWPFQRHTEQAEECNDFGSNEVDEVTGGRDLTRQDKTRRERDAADLRRHPGEVKLGKRSKDDSHQIE